MKYFSCLIKPASSTCNMSCRYCFYADESKRRCVSNYGIMDMQTAKILINNVFQTFCEDTDITFAFQGGEPTCAGLSFFNQFTKYVSEQKKKNHHIHYALQTNGTLIDDNWIQLLKDKIGRASCRERV